MLTAWLRPIIVLMIVVGLVEMMLPASTLRRYVELFLGLLVLAAILNPLVALLGGDLLWRPAGMDEHLPPADGGQPVLAQGRLAATGLAQAVFVDRLERELARLAATAVGVAAAQAQVQLDEGSPPDQPVVARVQVWLWLGQAEATGGAADQGVGGGAVSTPPTLPGFDGPEGAVVAGGLVGSVRPAINPVAPVAPIRGAGDDGGGGSGSGGGPAPAGIGTGTVGMGTDAAAPGVTHNTTGDGSGWFDSPPGPVGDTVFDLLRQHFNLRRDQVVLYWRPADGEGSGR